MSEAFNQQVGQAASRLLGTAADYLSATLASANASDHVADYMLHRATLRDLMIVHRTQTLLLAELRPHNPLHLFLLLTCNSADGPLSCEPLDQ